MSLNNDLKKALTKNDLASASKILSKRPLFGEKADINLIRLEDTGFMDETSPLLLWTYNRNVEFVKWALSHNANPNLTDEREARYGMVVKGITPLMGIILQWRQAPEKEITKCVSIADALLSAGANPNSGFPLSLVCYNRANSSDQTLITRLHLLNILLKAGADPNLQNNIGYFPLHSICTWFVDTKENLETNYQIIETLIKAGADSKVCTSEGLTPLHVAMNHNIGTVETALYLFKVGKLDINATDKWKRSALHYAATLGFYDGAHALLKNGADISIKDHLGKTPLDIAKEEILSQKNSASLPEHHDYSKCLKILEEGANV